MQGRLTGRDRRGRHRRRARRAVRRVADPHARVCATGCSRLAEQLTPSGNPRTGESLAARFAAKEALAKALGAPGDLHWHDAEVTVGEHGRPHLEVRGTVAGRAAQLGVTSWHLSLSHDGGIASAVVVAEGLPHAGAEAVTRASLRPTAPQRAAPAGGSAAARRARPRAR